MYETNFMKINGTMYIYQVVAEVEEIWSSRGVIIWIVEHGLLSCGFSNCLVRTQIVVYLLIGSGVYISFFLASQV